jgi:FMNH2-dependent dimethyl sulfone monooxygenase
MRYGYWLPVFGGWLRNVDDERMEASWAYNSRLAKRSEEIGYDLTLIAELNLNDIKGCVCSFARCLVDGCCPCRCDEASRVDGRSATNVSSASTPGKAGSKHRPHWRWPARLSLNVVSSWWADEAKKYGVELSSTMIATLVRLSGSKSFERLWSEDHFSFNGKHYNIDDAVLQPKPITHPRPVIYAGGESEAAKAMISRLCDAYVNAWRRTSPLCVRRLPICQSGGIS